MYWSAPTILLYVVKSIVEGWTMEEDEDVEHEIDSGLHWSMLVAWSSDAIYLDLDKMYLVIFLKNSIPRKKCARPTSLIA